MRARNERASARALLAFAVVMRAYGTVTEFSNAGRDFLRQGVYDIDMLFAARRCMQAHYRLTGLWELRYWHEADCLAAYDTVGAGGADAEAVQAAAHARCWAHDETPEAYLAEIELRLKVLLTDRAGERLRAERAARFQQQSAPHSQGPAAQRPPTESELPAGLLARFTMDNSARLYSHYFDDSHAAVYANFSQGDMMAMERLVRRRLDSLSYPKTGITPRTARRKPSDLNPKP